MFQLCQLPFHCRSCVVCITPSTLHPTSPFLPLGPGIPVSHVLSVRLQALLMPAQLSSPSSLSSHPTPPNSFCVSPSTASVLSEHTFYRPFSLLSGIPALNFLYLQLIVHAVLTFNLRVCLFFCLSCRCKEGYHGLRCDQFVPKTDAILSDPSTFSFLFFILQ